MSSMLTAAGRDAGSPAGSQAGCHTKSPVYAPGGEDQRLERSLNRRLKRSVSLLLKWGAAQHLKGSGALNVAERDVGSPDVSPLGCHTGVHVFSPCGEA